MIKQKVKLSGQNVIEAGEHDAIVLGGVLFVALITGLPEVATGDAANSAAIADDTRASSNGAGAVKAATTTKKTAATVAKPVVAAPPATGPRARAAAVAAPVVETVEDEFIPIPESEWKGLQPNDLVLAKLALPDDSPDKDKKWEAAVVGFKKPKGVATEKLHLKFVEDGTEDYVRDGDELFEYKVTE